MGKTRQPYPPEFRRQMVELVRAGRTPESLAREFEPTAESIRNWVRQAGRDEGRRDDGLTSPEREELRRLRRENRQLKIEREILAKAAAWFARETNSRYHRNLRVRVGEPSLVSRVSNVGFSLVLVRLRQSQSVPCQTTRRQPESVLLPPSPDVQSLSA